MIPYNDMWRIHRTNITKIASTNVSISVFDRAQEAESVHFLLNLLDSPDKLFDHIRREAGSVILKITYGYTTQARGNDPFVDLAGKTMAQFAEAAVPGKWMVDIFPFCKYYGPIAVYFMSDRGQCNICQVGSQEPVSKKRRDK
jgi:hypothetical protein